MLFAIAARSKAPRSAPARSSSQREPNPAGGFHGDGVAQRLDFASDAPSPVAVATESSVAMTTTTGAPWWAGGDDDNNTAWASLPEAK